MTRKGNTAPRFTQRKSSMTVRVLWRLYLELHCQPFTRSPANTAEYYDRYIDPEWGDVPLERITRVAVQRWVVELAATKGKPTSNRAFCVLASMINWGVRKGYIDAWPVHLNPVKGIDLFPAVYRERFLSKLELASFCHALELLNNKTAADFFWICILTGARKTAVLSMEWEELDLVNGHWTIPADKSKNGRSYVVALTEAAVEVLESRKRSSKYVFPGRRADQHYRSPRRAWRKILEMTGIKNLTIHDLRRSVGSHLAMNGASPFLIAQALGHKDLRSTQIYARLSSQAVREALSNIVSR